MLDWFVIYQWYVFSSGLVLVCGSVVTPAGVQTAVTELSRHPWVKVWACRDPDIRNLTGLFTGTTIT